MTEVQPHPLFGHGPWSFSEKNKAGDIVETKFDGATIGQRTYIEKDKYRAALRNAKGEYGSSNGFTKKRDLRHIASIPPSIWLKWCREYGSQALSADPRLLKRLIREHGLSVVRGKF